MQLNSVVIRLIRHGAGVGPDYSITIHGNGKVVYEGVDNVIVKGLVESTINDESVISILTEFRESNFFSLNENYIIEDSRDRPYTIISISLPKDNNEVVKKRVKYQQGYKNVYQELKKIEDKIQDVVGSTKWTGILPEPKEFTQDDKRDEKLIDQEQTEIKKRDISSNRKKKSVKLIVGIISIFVVICLILFTFYSGILNVSPEMDDESSETEETPPEIILVETGTDLDFITGEYTPENSFSRGDFVYIAQKYENILTYENETCNLYLEVTVTHNNTIYHWECENRTYIGKCLQIWYFETNYLWPKGLYSVTVNLTDQISNTTATSKTTSFYIL